jgi:hypothetical protein
VLPIKFFEVDFRNLASTAVMLSDK